jgi:hypothetical protein
MDQPSIFITTKDAEKLMKLIREAYHSEYRDSDYLEMLAEEMEKASVVNPDQIPAMKMLLPMLYRRRSFRRSASSIRSVAFRCAVGWSE